MRFVKKVNCEDGRELIIPFFHENIRKSEKLSSVHRWFQGSYDLCNRAARPNSQSMDWTISKMKKKRNYIFQWLCLVPTPVPIQEQRLPAILAPKRVRLPEPKRNAKGEQRAIRSSSSRQEEEEPWTQNHRSRQHNSRHRRRSKMNHGGLQRKGEGGD